MTRPTIQIGDESREMTENEYLEWQTLSEQIAAQNAADTERQSHKQSAIGKLSALGLNDDEINALIS